MDAAVALWRDNGWHRFDDHETNCTVQVFRWMDRACRSVPELDVISPRLEWVQPTPEMLAGTVSATKMPRPDLRLMIGRERGLTLECKRLSKYAPLPALYVTEGIHRFTRAKYAAGEPDGGLIGYVRPGPPSEAVEAVNAIIAADAGMGAAQILKRSETISSTIPDLYDSRHVRPLGSVIRLRHYLIEIPELRASA